jgi:arabinofuranosyltransferase
VAFAWVGYRKLEFLCDDAFIAFRYVSNAVDGLGWVWNPPPFRPVEGYTSFLWVALLTAVWEIFGAEPPAVANGISFAFGVGTLLLVSRMVLRMELPRFSAQMRTIALLVVLLGTVIDRTFLTWLSSGLETAMFNFLVTWWVFEATTPSTLRGPAFTARLGASAALTALARPDGLLFGAATVVLIALVIVAMPRPDRTRRALLSHAAACAPLLAVPLHLLFRHAFYGEWLPNTYYAKHTGAWPESGVRYLYAFLLENGAWVFVLVALPAVVLLGVRTLRRRRRLGQRFDAGALAAALAAIVPAGALLAHAGYYTFVIGGDHFEWRVYSHLVPLLFVALLALLSRLRARPSSALVAPILLALASVPIAWTHWDAAKDLTTRDETHMLRVKIADRFPEPFRTIVETWDADEDWLIRHHVGMRREEHVAFYEDQARHFPSRDDGRAIAWDERPTYALGVVGVAGWRLPHVAVIDVLGLNDWVVARSPARSVSEGEIRLMAHDRRAPPGYVQCFQPNVVAGFGRAHARARPTPLTDNDIRACEARFRSAVLSASDTKL